MTEAAYLATLPDGIREAVTARLEREERVTALKEGLRAVLAQADFDEGIEAIADLLRETAKANGGPAIEQSWDGFISHLAGAYTFKAAVEDLAGKGTAEQLAVFGSGLKWLATRREGR